MKKSAVLVVLCFLAAEVFSDEEGEVVIPFCAWCECTYEPGNGINLDCTNTDMNDILYDPYFWLDDFNATYRYEQKNTSNTTGRHFVYINFKLA